MSKFKMADPTVWSKICLYFWVVCVMQIKKDRQSFNHIAVATIWTFFLTIHYKHPTSPYTVSQIPWLTDKGFVPYSWPFMSLFCNCLETWDPTVINYCCSYICWVLLWGFQSRKIKKLHWVNDLFTGTLLPYILSMQSKIMTQKASVKGNKHPSYYKKNEKPKLFSIRKQCSVAWKIHILFKIL